MSLSTYFVLPKTIKRLKQGPLADFLDEFCNCLEAEGFSSRSIRKHIRSVSHWSCYLESCGITSREDIEWKQVNDWEGHLPHCTCRRKGAWHLKPVRWSINRALKLLVKKNPKIAQPQCVHSWDNLLQEYLAWLAEYRGASQGTRALRGGCLKRFLTAVCKQGSDLRELTGNDIEEFFYLTCCLMAEPNHPGRNKKF